MNQFRLTLSRNSYYTSLAARCHAPNLFYLSALPKNVHLRPFFNNDQRSVKQKQNERHIAANGLVFFHGINLSTLYIQNITFKTSYSKRPHSFPYYFQYSSSWQNIEPLHITTASKKKSDGGFTKTLIITRHIYWSKANTMARKHVRANFNNDLF